MDYTDYAATIVIGTSKHDQTKRTVRFVAVDFINAAEKAERRAAKIGGQVESLSRVVFE